nr:TPA: gp39-like protein [Oryctes rhinoceros nudivirus]
MDSDVILSTTYSRATEDGTTAELFEQISPPDSPLYEPSSPIDDVELEFFTELTPTESYTRASTNRKRIYGEEFKEPTILTYEPQHKLLKLDLPDHEEFDSNLIKQPIKQPTSTSTQSTNVTKNEPYPTKTERQYNIVSIDLADIPKLCLECYSPNCICYIIKQK